MSDENIDPEVSDIMDKIVKEEVTEMFMEIFKVALKPLGVRLDSLEKKLEDNNTYNLALEADANTNRNEKQIAELKERLDKHNKGISHLFDEKNTNRKVLRESIEFSNLLLELFLDAEILDEENHQRCYKEIKSMLEKLDVGSARQTANEKLVERVSSNPLSNEILIKETEKKEVILKKYICPKCKGIMKYLREFLSDDGDFVHELECSKCSKNFLTEYPNAFLGIEASGGEKEGGITDVSPVRVKRGGFLPDSKLPKPKYIKCEDCWFDLCAKRIEGHGCNKGRPKEKTEPEKDYKYILKSDISFSQMVKDVEERVRKELIEDLEKEWDFLYNKICREYFTLLKKRNPDIKPVFEMIDFYINSRRKKWRGKLKQ